ncbi:hypothetical protein JCM10212_000845 [Sporobolomyces blumeae]
MASTSDLKHPHGGEKGELQMALPVRFERTDPEDPFNWPLKQKLRGLAAALMITYVSAFNASANGAASSGFREAHPGVSTEVFQASSFTYLAMLGIGPLILAPISETFGRRPQLVYCSFIILVLFIPMALAPNVYALIFSRLVQGTAACIEGPTSAGIVADIWPKVHRGIPMGLFVLIVFTANATGPLVANWVAFTVNWHWVYWIQMCSNAFVFLYVLFFFKETRGEVILRKRCNALEKETGQPHYVEGAEQFEGWLDAVKLSCSRPLLYLLTEPIVTALALWVGFAWGSVFLLVGTIAHVFAETYGFNKGEASTVLICGFIGAAIGCATNVWIQEPMYQRAVQRGQGKAKPEVRLYSAAVGSLLFAAGCFAFAGTARPSVHWIVPAIFICVLNVGIYTIYLGTYSYIGDTYQQYSSSGQAAQSLLRNILGATFPFFGVSMYDNLGFTAASCVVGGIAAALAVVPWVLILYGAKLRQRSKVAMALEQQEGEILSDGGVAEEGVHVEDRSHLEA